MIEKVLYECYNISKQINKLEFEGKIGMDVKSLYRKLNSISYKELFEIEPEIFTVLSKTSFDDRLPYVNAYLTISNWFGTSLRSGVWTFYEVTKLEEIDTVLTYLKENNYTDLAEIFEKGVHDYQNPIYAKDFDYPEEWIEESEEIDQWIMEHEEWLWQWER